MMKLSRCCFSGHVAYSTSLPNSVAFSDASNIAHGFASYYLAELRAQH